MKIPIKYHADIDPIKKIDNGDWIDLRAAEDVHLEFGEFALISLGVSMKLPEGYEAHVLPRSSTFKKYGIVMTNSMGIIDNSYSGTNDIWLMPALCLWKGGCNIKKNERIAQFRIVKKQPEVAFDEVMFLDETDRGGIGSTGRV
jgi:dUTP pyrophosphatase